MLALTVAANDDQWIGVAVHAIPWADGNEVWVWVEVTDEIGTATSGLLCDSVSESCRGMTCSAAGCSGSLVGLPARTTVVGQMSVTLTLSPTQTWASGPLPFTRAFAPASELTQIASPDNVLELTLFPNSLPADSYVLILAASTLPGAPPLAHRLVGRPYNVRASGALVLSDKPLALRLAYDALWLDNATPHNLSVFAWDPFDQSWDEKGGALFTDHNHLSTPIQRFTTYALLEIPAWRDTFADASGLSLANGTHPSPEGALVLSDDALSGAAISVPITPTMAAYDWDRLIFTHTTTLTTNLTVDVLNLDGGKALTDVVSGASLADLHPTQYPALKLQATLSSTVAGQTPVLDAWRLTWRAAEQHKTYVPLVLKK